ncbi:MAG: YdcF family protein [Bacteroidetes bacterium]|nr:YdcF family protein [Bacteroidota bacterium]
MFFFFSKLLIFTITPLVWIIALLLISLFAKKTKIKKYCLIASISLLLFFSNSFILDEFMRAWEIKAVQDCELKQSYDYGILLSGMTAPDKKYKRLNFLRSSDRLLQTIRLYKQNRIKKIFISGGSGSIIQKEYCEARDLKNYLIQIGVPEEDIITEINSRNTRENAEFTAKILLNKEQTSSCLLITSAFHMRRSKGCFNKTGLKVDIYPTDRYAGQRKYIFDHLFIPNHNAFNSWNLLIHEVTGYITYAVVGYV